MFLEAFGVERSGTEKDSKNGTGSSCRFFSQQLHGAFSSERPHCFIVAPI